MATSGTARDTLRIVEQRGYTAPLGARVDLSAAIEAAFDQTLLYLPEEAGRLELPPATGAAPRCVVTAEGTTQAIHRRYRAGAADLLALNFASAKNPGGGFLGGARAQEEDVCRASALQPYLLLQPRYYEANRACGTMLYTDHMIYTRGVPFFREEDLALCERPSICSILTAPAPNAGQHLRQGGGRRPLRDCLQRRARMVLEVCAHQGHRDLILGAWGCGVFKNDPAEVAGIFHELLLGGSFAGRFDHVTFAIYDRTPRNEVLRAFEAVFGEAI